MTTEPPKSDEKKMSTAAMIEGAIAGFALTLWISKHWTMDRGWYWIIGFSTLLIYAALFERSVVFRIVAAVIATPFVMMFAYGIGTAMIGYPIGILFSLFGFAISVGAHILPPVKGESALVRGTAFNTFEAARARAAALLGRGSKKKD